MTMVPRDESIVMAPLEGRIMGPGNKQNSEPGPVHTGSTDSPPVIFPDPENIIKMDMLAVGVAPR